MYKRLQLLKIVGFAAASDCGFESCPLIETFKEALKIFNAN